VRRPPSSCPQSAGRPVLYPLWALANRDRATATGSDGRGPGLVGLQANVGSSAVGLLTVIPAEQGVWPLASAADGSRRLS
jgi:hypothetical protein